jgi:hypothetical protein
LKKILEEFDPKQIDTIGGMNGKRTETVTRTRRSLHVRAEVKPEEYIRLKIALFLQGLEKTRRTEDPEFGEAGKFGGVLGDKQADLRIVHESDKIAVMKCLARQIVGEHKGKEFGSDRLRFFEKKHSTFEGVDVMDGVLATVNPGFTLIFKIIFYRVPDQFVRIFKRMNQSLHEPILVFPNHSIHLCL